MINDVQPIQRLKALREGEMSEERICEEKPGRRGNKWRENL